MNETHVDERIGLDPTQLREVAGKIGRALGDGLDRGDADVSPTALLAEEAEVLLAVRGDLAEHRDALMTVALEPRDHERRVAATITVAEPEAVLALEAFGAGPTDERHLQRVGERAHGSRVVGAVRARDRDAAFVDEPAKSVGRVLGRTVRQAVLGVQHELDRTIEQTRLGRLVGEPARPSHQDVRLTEPPCADARPCARRS